MANPNINRKAILISQSPYDIDTLAYFSKLTIQPSTTRKAIIQTLITTLKSDNNWNKLDRLCLFASETQQAATISLVNPGSTPLTEVSGPTWVADQGYTSNGTTQYLNTNYNFSTSSVNYTVNSGCMGFYARTNTVGAVTDMGAYDATNMAAIYSRYTGDISTYHINNNILGTLPASTDSKGMWLAMRPNATTKSFYRNGSLYDTQSVNSSGIPAYTCYIMNYNNSGGLGNAAFATRQYSLYFIGSATIDQAKLYTAIQAYMTALGTQV